MVCLFLGFKLKDFLHENETLSTFLQQNASFSHNYVQNILEADVNLEKVSIENIILRHKSCPRLFKLWPNSSKPKNPNLTRSTVISPHTIWKA